MCCFFPGDYLNFVSAAVNIPFKSKTFKSTEDVAKFIIGLKLLTKFSYSDAQMFIIIQVKLPQVSLYLKTLYFAKLDLASEDLAGIYSNIYEAKYYVCLWLKSKLVMKKT